jgi:hypothetical protein
LFANKSSSIWPLSLEVEQALLKTDKLLLILFENENFLLMLLTFLPRIAKSEVRLYKWFT